MCIVGRSDWGYCKRKERCYSEKGNSSAVVRGMNIADVGEERKALF